MRPKMRAEDALPGVPEIDLRRFDAIVLILGLHDVLRFTAVPVWRRHMSALLSAVAEASSDRLKVVVLGIPPIRSISIFDTFLGGFADRHARALNRESALLCAQLPQAVFVPLAGPRRRSSDEGRHRSPQTYAEWGTLLAESLGPLLDTEAHSDPRRLGDAIHAVPGAVRQKAVDELVLADSQSEDRFARILSLLQSAFRADSAMITVLDNDRQRYLAQVGVGMPEIPRTDAFCEVTIGGRDAMVVRNALEDDRFKDNPSSLDSSTSGSMQDSPSNSTPENESERSASSTRNLDSRRRTSTRFCSNNSHSLCKGSFPANDPS